MFISNAAVKFKPAVFTAVFFFIIAGIYCYFSLPREHIPDITIPYVFISTSYEGVSPEEIENLVAIQLEKKLKGLDNVKEISSSSIEGFSNITIEFYPSQNIDDAVQKVKDKIDLARADLPDDIDEPIVSEINLSTDIPILSVVFSGDHSLTLLKEIAEDIQDSIENVPGVLEAKIFGDREREIRVEVDIARLNAYRIPVTELIKLISQENTTVSAGNIEMTGGKFQIRIPGEFAAPGELDTLILLMRNGVPVYLTDIAEIKDTFKDLSTISRVRGKPCVSLMVQKRSGENIIRIISEVKRILEKAKEKFPKGVDYVITSDMSEDTYMMLYELENNIVSGLFLVLLVLLFVMGLRNSFLVATAIPLSMLITFVTLSAFSITLNMIVLFSLILASGMLVDNAIVIVENIYRHSCLGFTPADAAKNGTSEVAWPVITSTLTTLAAFLPLLFWPDVIGEFMSYLPKTAIIALSASLLVAIVVNPVLCACFIKPGKWKSHEESAGFLHKFGGKILNVYENILKECLSYSGLVVGLAALILVLVCMLYIRYQTGVELFPDSDPKRSDIRLRFPEGTEIEKTDKVVAEIEDRLKKFSDIDYILSTVGQGEGSLFAGGTAGTHLATILVEFKDIEKRRYCSFDLVDAMRININGYEDFKIEEGGRSNIPTGSGSIIKILAEKDPVNSSIKTLISSTLTSAGINADVVIEETPESSGERKSILISAGKDTKKIMDLLRQEQHGFSGVEIIVGKEKKGPPTGAPVSVEISGDDFDILTDIVEMVKVRIQTIPGLVDIRDDYEEARPELKFIVDRKRIAILGLDTSTVANFIRTAINGSEVSKYREGEDEYDITIRLPERQRLDTDILSQMEIPVHGGWPIALSNLGRFTYDSGYGTIRRKNLHRTITIDADARSGYGVDDVLTAIRKKLSELSFPKGYTIRYRGENEDQNEASAFLSKAFLIAIFLIAIILIVQFNSIFLSAIILTSVLLSFIGVFSGLLICQMRFSVIMTGLGIISLAGVVVNNAIVLVDCAQKQRENGKNAIEAVLIAGKLRFRPVFLTAITTVLGLIPMAVGWSMDIHSFPPAFIAGAESSQWWAPMAIVVIFGLSVATVLTLIVVPALYCFIDRVMGTRRL